MKNTKSKLNRRNFIKNAALGTALISINGEAKSSNSEDENSNEEQYDKPIMDHEPAVIEQRQLNTNQPIFILADNFQRILGRIKTTKEMLKELENNVFTFNEFKTKEDKKFHILKSKMEDIQRKLIYVDKTLFNNRW